MDKRQHPRFNCDLETEVRAGGRALSARALDISRGGICLCVDRPVPVGATIEVALRLVLSETQYSEPLILRARTMWCTTLKEGHQLGCMFGQLPPEHARYLEMFLRFLRGTSGEDPGTTEADPDNEPFA